MQRTREVSVLYFGCLLVLEALGMVEFPTAIRRTLLSVFVSLLASITRVNSFWERKTLVRDN